MRRKTFDTLMATGGLVLAILLIAAGGMLTWAHGFVHDQVTTQLSAQHIVFPERAARAWPTRRSSRTSRSTPASS